MFYLAFCPFVAQGMSQLSAFYYIEHHILHIFRISLRMVRHCTHGYSSPGTHSAFSAAEEAVVERTRR